MRGEAFLPPLLSLFLPDRCVACSTPLESMRARHVCGPCWVAARRVRPPLCRCGFPLADSSQPECLACAVRPSPFGQGRSGFLYESPFREVIHAFKYEGRRQLARHIAARLMETPDLSLDGAQLVPVPSHPTTLRDRGYNPAEDLAAALSRRLGVPCRRLLKKIRRTPPQMTLSARERALNLHAAFAPSMGACRKVRGAHLILVDDVVTTGATLRECAAVLLRAGATRVDFITAARAL